MKESQAKIIAREQIDLFKDVRFKFLKAKWPDDNKDCINFGYCINDYTKLSDLEMQRLIKLRTAAAWIDCSTNCIRKLV